MKIRTGSWKDQFSLGFTIVNYHNDFKALVLDIGFWYVEFIFKDYEAKEMDTGSEDS